MAPKVKAAVDSIREALAIATAFAVCSALAYALLFMDLTGNGRLWDAMRGLANESAGVRGAPAVQIRRVPVRPIDREVEAQNRMLALPEVAREEIKVDVLAAQQPLERPAPPERVTDAPADKGAVGDWRKHLSGELRRFTVYGQGEQPSQSGGAAPAAAARGTSAAASRPAPTPAAAASAYAAGPTAEPRPGIGDHVSRVSGGAADGVRNFR